MDIMEKLKKISNDISDTFLLSERQIGYGYEEEFGFYRIWHTKENLEDDKECRKIIGNIARKYLTKEELRNLVVVYDYEKEIAFNNHKCELSFSYSLKSDIFNEWSDSLDIFLEDLSEKDLEDCFMYDEKSNNSIENNYALAS